MSKFLFVLILIFSEFVFAKPSASVCEKLFEFNKTKTSESIIYVDSEGQAFPSIAYRYYSYKQLKILISMLNKTGELTINDKNWIYITFEKYNTAFEAKNFLQVPHDASIRVTFSLSVDTAVIRVPKGKYGKGYWLEPLAKDHPQFGKGGGSQYIISNSTLKILEIYEMKE